MIDSQRLQRQCLPRLAKKKKKKNSKSVLKNLSKNNTNRFFGVFSSEYEFNNVWTHHYVSVCFGDCGNQR